MRADRTARFEHAQRPGAARSRRLVWRIGLHPFRRFPPSPAQAGRAASTARAGGSSDLVVVLVDCSGCRSRREASGPGSHLGLAIRPCARVVKGRRKPARGGKAASTVTVSMIPYLRPGRCASNAGRRVEARASAGASRSGGEALVDRRRSGSGEAVAFDEAVVEAGPGGSPVDSAARSDLLPSR